jgi:hypothetical protein
VVCSVVVILAFGSLPSSTSTSTWWYPRGCSSEQSFSSAPSSGTVSSSKLAIAANCILVEKFCGSPSMNKAQLVIQSSTLLLSTLVVVVGVVVVVVVVGITVPSAGIVVEWLSTGIGKPREASVNLYMAQFILPEQLLQKNF